MCIYIYIYMYLQDGGPAGGVPAEGPLVGLPAPGHEARSRYRYIYIYIYLHVYTQMATLRPMSVLRFWISETHA